MFGAKKKKVSEEELDEIRAAGAEDRATVFPEASIPESIVELDKRRSYEELAKQLDFAPAELTRAQLLTFFESERIELYDYKQVEAWLTTKKEEAKAKSWCWRPLREQDVITDYRWGWDGKKSVWTDGFYSSKDWGCRPYERLVPAHALEKVAKIKAEFGGRVKFFVSDFASSKPDPFIMVRPTMCDSGTVAEYCMVFDVWDEPGFGA